MTELLSPAGSIESLHAAIEAGADAVYAGGDLFSARAYARNFTTEELQEALDYVHLHGSRLYLTLNTLVKEREMEQIVPFVRPLYEKGLDAVLVQDFGVLSLLKRAFPDLPLHASTQMTAAGSGSVKFLQKEGLSRIVLSRELSLNEIRAIREETGAELETFIHGALCCGYSGQCLLSSMLGGRSGNRGRCAQPCRLPYRAADGKERYYLSLKDLNTLSILPDLVLSGIASLKIEGRMKDPQYAYHVTAIYRKYLDQIEAMRKEGRSDEEIRKAYRVLSEDEDLLSKLYIRSETGSGYYSRRNGREMITLSKPGYSAGLDGKKRRSSERNAGKRGLSGSFSLSEQAPAILRAACLTEHGLRYASARSMECAVPAKNVPLTPEGIKERLEKTGNTPFFFSDMTIQMEDGLFLSVRAMNELRRSVLEQMEAVILADYRRTVEPFEEPACLSEVRHDLDGISVSVMTKDQLAAVSEATGLRMVWLEPALWNDRKETIAKESVRLRKSGTGIGAALPYILREEDRCLLSKAWENGTFADVDAFLARNTEELEFLIEKGDDRPRRLDSSIYTWNKESLCFWEKRGESFLTMPVELNAGEMKSRGFRNTEVLVYGRIPLMITAQCLTKTTDGCTKEPSFRMLTDRYRTDFPVRNECGFCQNIIYNSVVLSLGEELPSFREEGCAAFRLAFTTETKDACRQVLSLFLNAERDKTGFSLKEEIGSSFTRGHYTRGVE